jgi:hypothetical protein
MFSGSCCCYLNQPVGCASCIGGLSLEFGTDQFDLTAISNGCTPRSVSCCLGSMICGEK